MTRKTEGPAPGALVTQMGEKKAVVVPGTQLGGEQCRGVGREGRSIRRGTQRDHTE